MSTLKTQPRRAASQLRPLSETMIQILPVILAALLANPEPTEARLDYTLHFYPRDTSGISIQLKVRNAPASMQLAARSP